MLVISYFVLGWEETKNSLVGSLIFPIFTQITAGFIDVINFEDIMNDWNLRWKAALRGIRYATVIESDSENADDNIKQSAPVVEITPEYQEFLEAIRSNEQE